MDARLLRAAVLAAAFMSLGASYRTENFLVTTRSPRLAEKIGKMAEHYRKTLAIQWLGRELPRWRTPCPITAQVAPHLGAGGATSFMFQNGQVGGWRMTIQGSEVRLLDSVLPHEVTHTIFATYFRQPLPRWADEGACTTVEHISERKRHEKMLIQFLKTERGISFSQMFAMKEYPPDVLPLYAQGYSLARFLIQQGGRRKFVKFVGDGLRDEQWVRALRQNYEVDSLGRLQNTWLAWVKRGSPTLAPAGNDTGVAATFASANSKRTRPEPNLLMQVPHGQAPGNAASRPDAGPAAATNSKVATRGWHAAGQQQPATVGMAGVPQSSTHQAATQQPIQRPRQEIIQR